jgi:uncharacterized protein YrzB (UPF0473 family)
MTENQEKDIITLCSEDGEETTFEVLGVITVEDQDYAFLVPLDDEDSEEAYIFRIDKDGDEDILVEVEDDDEFEKVAQAWEEIYGDEFDDFEEYEDYEDEDE